MVIDSNHSAGRAALAFVHEMNHAYYHKIGLRPDITALGREEYVNAKVSEEAEGVVKSIEAKIELEGTDVSITGLSYPLETEYREAYKARYDELIAAGKSEEEAGSTARITGMERVIKGFMDGEVSTSNSGQSYPEYYGEAWDEVNGD